MMYNNKMIAVIKVNGKILREVGDTVFIPFGSEYSIHFSNHNNVAASVDVSIDGEDVLDGNTLAIRAGMGGKVEGFLKGNTVSHKFKFIEKTEQISEYRGDKISDGIIRITYQFEKQRPEPVYNPYYGGSVIAKGIHSRGISGGNTYGEQSFTNRTSTDQLGVLYSTSSDTLRSSATAVNDSGITVNGGSSDQSFVNTSLGILEDKIHVIVFQLKGQTDSGVIEEPILVKTKLKCDTCGKPSKSSAKFCSSCGTSLVI